MYADALRESVTNAFTYDLGPATLKIARNEIYARKGRRFQDPELRDWFSRFAWYHPCCDEVELNAVEKANVATIREAEARYGQ